MFLPLFVVHLIIYFFRLLYRYIVNSIRISEYINNLKSCKKEIYIEYSVVNNDEKMS